MGICKTLINTLILFFLISQLCTHSIIRKDKGEQLKWAMGLIMSMQMASRHFSPIFYKSIHNRQWFSWSLKVLCSCCTRAVLLLVNLSLENYGCWLGRSETNSVQYSQQKKQQVSWEILVSDSQPTTKIDNRPVYLVCCYLVIASCLLWWNSHMHTFLHLCLHIRGYPHRACS